MQPTPHRPKKDNPAPEPALRFEGIRKRFFGVEVLKGVGFEVPAGETVGLVGENGAGKSTLMNILGGNLRPDAGTMTLEGRPHHPATPHEARAAGIAFVHQELNLFPNLSIAENLFLAGFPTRAGLIRRKAIHARAATLLEEVGLKLPPETKVEALSAGERQLVEIAKALSIEPRLVIFDEPTTSLTAHEAAHFFGLLRLLQGRGIPMVYISHNLGEVLNLCHGVVVLRDGELAGKGPRAEFTSGRMVSMMVGREISQLFPPPAQDLAKDPAKPPALAARGVRQPGVAKNITLEVARGEVVGVAGLMGSGRTELARMLFGLDPMAGGTVEVAGEPVHALPPHGRIARGLAFLTESRREEGLCMEASIDENITLASAPRRSGPLGWIDQAALGRDVADIRNAVTLTASARGSRAVKTLSGGNQQKVVLAKWLLNKPKALILDEPTRGIDIGAKCEIYGLIRQLAERGAGILMISSEIEELTGMCDRIVVMRRGEITLELARAAFDRERLLRAALHGGDPVRGEGAA